MTEPPTPDRTKGNSRSSEYDRFRDLTRRLISVPKKEINGQPQKQKAKKKGR